MIVNHPSRNKLRIGVANNETWRFLSEIYEDLSHHHQTNLFKWRTFNSPLFHLWINRFVFNADMQSFMRKNDVVYFEWASGLLAPASKLRKQTGIVTRLHRYEMYRWVDKINWEAVDKIIFVSEVKKQEFLGRFPEQAEKIVVIPVAIDIQKFHPQSKKFNGDIGILCDLKPRKRVYELILSFFELTKSLNRFHLHIGGGEHGSFPDYYLAIQNLIKKLDLVDKVTLYGNVIDPENWYHKIDIFISNSYSEGLQVAPMEAMASGCYCLSHHWAGADELVPEENLFYTNKEMQEKILEYCNSSETHKQSLRERMRTIVSENFNIEETKTQIRAVIEEVGQLKN